MQVKVYKVNTSMNIRDFLQSQGITYSRGIGFYQLSSKKNEMISDIKMVIVRRKSDGALITGDGVRTVLGLPDSTVSFSIKNETLNDFDIFVQSTSPQRKLLEGADMLCKVESGGINVLETNPKLVEPVVPKSVDTPLVEPVSTSTGLIADGVNAVEVLITFDTTGSMYPCISQVRRSVRQLIKDLFHSIPGVRLAVLAHGDYGDTYVTKHIDLSVDQEKLSNFVETVGSTCGGDWEECYELVLRKAHSEISWSGVAKKVVMMIGDAVPHEANSYRNAEKIDWKVEADIIKKQGIHFYSVQALGGEEARTRFWRPLAERTGGVHLNLDQFAHTKDFIMAICFHSYSQAQVSNFRNQVKDEGRMNRSLHNMFNTLLKEASTFDGEDHGLKAVPPSRFQILDVGNNKTSIKQFAETNGLKFKVGRGFYEFSKSEVISEKKEVVLMDKKTGDMFTGPEAINLIGAGSRNKIKPKSLEKWRVFVQSTSVNRALVPHTGFLYEVDGS